VSASNSGTQAERRRCVRLLSSKAEHSQMDFVGRLAGMRTPQ